VFYVKYMLSELRRRKGRTLLTAFGLAVGVGLVVTVSALSAGLDDAQAKVLKPLTGVGTDMSVTRPIAVPASSSGSGGPPFARLSEKERQRLEKENGGARIGGLQNLKPGTHFTRDSFMSTAQLSFPASEVQKIAGISGVESAAGGLTLTELKASGTVPESAPQGGGRFVGPGGGNFSGPRTINVNPLTITGVDQAHKDLGALTAGQVSKGRYFSAGSKREAILNVSYAQRKNLGLGDTITIGGKKFTVIGIANTPLGGQSSDVYVKLSQLQKMSDRVGRVNTVYVRATTSDKVAQVASTIKSSFSSSSVTTAQDLADRVSGSLVDAKNLTSKLGTTLEIVGMLAAVLIASLLTLSSVAKRVRELGTLKAVGWSQRLVVRQVTGEALLQGLIGGGLGVLVGIGGALLVDAIGINLKATVASAGGPTFGPFGQGAVDAGSTVVHLSAPLSIGLIVLAVVLAVAGGLVAGAFGGLRAARLRPAEALRTIE
jgi:ABC-type antimicrobial peptide transport system permease subunit